MNTGVFASKYNFGINNLRFEPARGPSPHLPNVRVHSHASLFSRKFWASKVMYRGSTADILVVLCKPGNLTTNNVTEGDYTHLDDFLRLSGM